MDAFTITFVARALCETSPFADTSRVMSPRLKSILAGEGHSGEYLRKGSLDDVGLHGRNV